ncbi:MAG: hypothetical protein D6793_03510 [Thermoflexia bacterium]|nr:MAG: hypothetical protein D6793_03510 [Thermoflexia bacterium]
MAPLKDPLARKLGDEMRKGTVLLALFLILIGTYALLVEFIPQAPSLEQLWPVLIIAVGITLLISYFRQKGNEPIRVFWGVFLTLGGLFLSLISLTDQNYAVLATWWPAFVLIAGIAFLALWLAEGIREWGTLFLALVSLVFGGAYLAVNLQILGPNTALEVRRLWPVLLILAGLILFVRGVLGKK